MRKRKKKNVGPVRNFKKNDGNTGLPLLLLSICQFEKSFDHHFNFPPFFWHFSRFDHTIFWGEHSVEENDLKIRVIWASKSFFGQIFVVTTWLTNFFCYNIQWQASRGCRLNHKGENQSSSVQLWTKNSFSIQSSTHLASSDLLKPQFCLFKRPSWILHTRQINFGWKIWFTDC